MEKIETKFETKQSTQDSVLQLRDDEPKQRERAYSQQNYGNHNDEDSLMENNQQHDAYSQIGPERKNMSEAGGDTESENESDAKDDPAQEKDNYTGTTLITKKYF